MFKQEKIKPYHEDGRKGEQVEQMFDSIAHSYDTLNHRLSWNIDKRWRKVAINQLKPYKPQTMLDIATGTGDFAIMAAKILQPKKMLCTGFSTEMMNIGKQKVKQLQMDHFISFAKEDCMNLSLPDNQFDAVTTAFAIRNFENLEKGFVRAQVIYDMNAPMRFLYRQIVKLWQPADAKLPIPPFAWCITNPLYLV